MNHKGGSCILFKDGHVEFVKMDPKGRHTNRHLRGLDTDIYAIDTEPRHPDDADLN